MVTSTLRPLYPQGKSLWCHWICRWEGPSSENRKCLLHVTVLDWAPRPDDAGLQGNWSIAPSIPKAPYTLSVTLSDFTVWRYNWRKNWVNCVVLTGNSAGLGTVLSSRLSHREIRSSLRESHSFLILPAATTMASSQGTSVLAIHSADEHRMIYPFSNTTSYYKFYAFFSSFRITLCPMWLANSTRQPCFYPP